MAPRRGAARSARRREPYTALHRGRRGAAPCEHPLGPRAFRGGRRREPLAGGARRGGVPRGPDRHRGADRSRRHPRARTRGPHHLRVACRHARQQPDGLRRPRARGARAHRSGVRGAKRGAGRGLRHHRPQPAACALCQAARRPRRAHRRAGRLVHRGRHPHRRPARTVAGALRRLRRGLRTDGFAPRQLPPHGEDPGPGLDALQHHAVQDHAPGAARPLLRVGLGVPGRTRRPDALGVFRRPAAARSLPRRTHTLREPRRQPRGGHAQRHAAPRLRHRGRRGAASDRRVGHPDPVARLPRGGGCRRLHRLRRPARRSGRGRGQLLRAQQQRPGHVPHRPGDQRPGRRHARLRPGGAAIRPQHHAAGNPQLRQLRRQGVPHDRLRPRMLPPGRRAGAGRERPLGARDSSRWTPCLS